MFKRILIANRGEIAMRIIRACRELGIRTVAIYAECDATAIFVKKADEAHRIGPDPVQGFLDMQAIVDLAKRSGANGIHPGTDSCPKTPISRSSVKPPASPSSDRPRKPSA